MGLVFSQKVLSLSQLEKHKNAKQGGQTKIDRGTHLEAALYDMLRASSEYLIVCAVRCIHRTLSFSQIYLYLSQ